MRTIAVLVACLLASPAAAAQLAAPTHSGGGHGPRAVEEPAATGAFRAANAAMMRAMDVPYTGDADVDFRIHMISHHEGAVAMARVALDHATDPAPRSLARTIIADQKREIAAMKAWLSTRGR